MARQLVVPASCCSLSLACSRDHEQRGLDFSPQPVHPPWCGIYAIREWARHNGFDLADRGRIPDHVIDAFGQAQATASKTTKRRRKTKRPAVSD
ncbi:Lsr2 family DNA-binding protein [Actinophytocola sp.]|uniref:Lsr2 family DNA-binding protein n=1 Tax=Actinophytocola sp. TaxID=1872138 RepID=UPI0039C8A10B